MSEAARLSCQKFIDAFGARILEKYTVGKVPWVLEEFLGIDEMEEGVYQCLRVDLGKDRGDFVFLRIDNAPYFYKYEWDYEELIKRFGEVMELEPADAKVALKRGGFL